uniref:39S ribosomal protein L37, mitochondrial n=2 Tax=Caenorhabditis japonica TaxID=281687 RepID=A0A8R1DR02_CAEJA
MVFRKYRAVKQWGKMDTRIFKEIYSSRNKRKMPGFEVPDAVKALGAPVFETNQIFTLSNNKNLVENAREHVENEVKFSDQVHPLQQNRPAYIFEAAEPMSDGIAQAALLTRSVVRNGLPEAILHNQAVNLDISEEMVRDAILHGERFNPTLEKLPKRFDPVMFWIRHVRLHGTPVIKRNNIILNNLFRHVMFAGLRSGAFKQTMHVNRDDPLSVYISGGRYFSKTPLVLRAQPHLTIQTEDSTVIQPWAGNLDVKAASSEPLPDIYPISPVIDFEQDSIYNDDVLLTRREQKAAHVHSILWAREQDQKYPWTSEQNMANAILTTYAAAIAEATRNGATELKKPLGMSESIF